MKKYGYVAALILMIGCGQKEKTQKKPENLLDKDEITKILIDLHLAEAEVSALNLKKDTSQYLYQQYQHHILNQHNTTDSIYYQSYDYYLAQPETFEKIYETVVDTLSSRRRQYEQDERKSREEAQ